MSGCHGCDALDVVVLTDSQQHRYSLWVGARLEVIIHEQLHTITRGDLPKEYQRGIGVLIPVPQRRKQHISAILNWPFFCWVFCDHVSSFERAVWNGVMLDGILEASI